MVTQYVLKIYTHLYTGLEIFTTEWDKNIVVIEYFTVAMDILTNHNKDV